MCSKIEKTYERLDPRTNKIYVRNYVSSLSHFKELRNFFYINQVKCIPENIDILFNAQALAFWFMDDGGRNSSQGSKGLVIYVSGFNRGPRIGKAIDNQNMMLYKLNCQICSCMHEPLKASRRTLKPPLQCRDFLPFNLGRKKPYRIPSMFYKLTC